MSKAFTRENDDAPEPESAPRPRAGTLPPGTRNYVTADGAAAFREELGRLSQEERPRWVGAADPESRARLEAVESRIRELDRILRTAVVPRPPPAHDDRVRFGARVVVVDGDGVQSRYRIVGVDEADPDRGWISWVSPLARALIGSRVGDRVSVQTPDGETTVELVEISQDR
jgi:transcription elongation factor GreB